MNHTGYEPNRAIILKLAASTCGGVNRLAAQLGVSVATLEQWLNGQCVAPDEVVMKAIDLLLEHDDQVRERVYQLLRNRDVIAPS